MTDVYSIAGNKLTPYTEIGMPFHGLSTNGTLPHPTGNKTIPQPSIYGPCQVIRHPIAPGVDRNTNQISHDNAKGLEWRDYALLTGPGHGVNGTAELGPNKWLYCDPGGNTWVINFTVYDPGDPEQVTHRTEFVGHQGFPVSNTGTLNNSQIVFDLVLEEIWGRFGKVYEFTSRVIGNMTWTPDIPTWYGGAFTAADVVNAANFAHPESVVVNQAGSSAFVHVYCDSDTISGAVYPETQPIFNATNNNGFALVGIIEVTISGTGDLVNNGAGITSTVQDHLRYESGLMLTRTYTLEPETGTESWNIIKTLPACPDPYPPEQLLSHDPDFRVNNTGDSVGAGPTNTWVDKAILYKTFAGQVTREVTRVNDAYWDLSFTNTTNDIYNLSNDLGSYPLRPIGCDGGGSSEWALVSCTVSGHIVRVYENGVINRTVVEYDVFGEIYRYDLRDDDGFHSESDVGGGGIIGRCERGPADTNSYNYRNVTLNGQALSDWAPVYHEFRIVAPNLVYVVIDQPQTTVTTRDMIENVVAVNENGVAAKLLDKTTAHAPETNDRGIPDLRELAWSYQPVTEENTHGPALLFAANNNDVYQYV